MRKLTEWLLRHRTATVVVFALLTAGSLLLYPLVQVNYDLSEYLPQDSMTKRAMEEMEESFGYDAVLRVMVEDVTLSESLDIKENALPNGGRGQRAVAGRRGGYPPAAGNAGCRHGGAVLPGRRMQHCP